MRNIQLENRLKIVMVEENYQLHLSSGIGIYASLGLAGKYLD